MPLKPKSVSIWEQLRERLDGELYTDETYRILYATDASVYRSLPEAVLLPKTEMDILHCVDFARAHGRSITPRAGGTSLAGQAVGDDLVIDVSKYLNKIVEINPEQGYAIVQPGVIRDQLNAALRPLGYWFGPNTSTANRCTLGGMFGNNSCGSTSITVGSTREHVLAANLILSDGTPAVVNEEGLKARALSQVPASEPDAGGSTDVAGKPRETQVTKDPGSSLTLLDTIEQTLANILDSKERQTQIRAAFPQASVARRNTGYALDLLLDQAPYDPNGAPQNLCTLLAGSEGTLAFTTELKVRILPLPQPGSALAAIHFADIDGMMRATQTAMTFKPFQCEVMDDTILHLARKNKDQAKNAAFVIGDPRGLLLVEFRANTDAEAAELALAAGAAIAAEPSLQTSYLVTEILTGADEVDRAWSLRKAGLGILGNMVGDAKAVACIEDTAVAIEDLADYIAEVEILMKLYGQSPVYYAHAGAGEIHLRPVLNLKNSEDREAFYNITRDVAKLVKKYRGSLSGEHGDGRVRAAFLPDMLGPEVYQLMVDVKRIWDPRNVFNPGKIVEAPPMNESLRYVADQTTPKFKTALDWSADEGLLRAAEKCNGSGDCRKLDGGAMCPSYRATLSELHGTRGRANALREVLTRNQHDDAFQHPALDEAMDLCLSCKACTSECPSSVDMTNLKAEYLYQKRQTSLRTKLIAANEPLYRLGAKMPTLANAALKITGPLIKRVAGIASARSLPPIAKQTVRRWFEGRHWSPTDGPEVNVFCDEFTDLQDAHVGKAAITLLHRLGYRVHLPTCAPSGRAHLSKGLLDEARRYAERNVAVFGASKLPVIGLEPSAILGFRDEYPKLLRGEEQRRAQQLANRVYTFDEFLFRELEAGRISPEDFGPRRLNMVLHVHCHEKALGDKAVCATALSLPKNFAVTLLDSGCCGMAGSFGYEAEHYDLSVRIAEQSLLRHLRGLPTDTVVVANGTSCRHQVKDLLQIRAVSTAEALLLSY